MARENLTQDPESRPTCLCVWVRGDRRPHEGPTSRHGFFRRALHRFTLSPESFSLRIRLSGFEFLPSSP